MKTKTYIGILTVLLSSLFLVSCSGSFFVPIFFTHDEDQPDFNTDSTDKTAKLFEMIRDKDEDGFKNMFSESTSENVKDFDSQVKKLFDYIEGDVIDASVQPMNEEAGKAVDEYTQDRYYSCIMTTSKAKYMVEFGERSIDTSNPKNIGFYSFYIYPEEQKNPVFEDVPDGFYCPGIHIAKED